MYSSGDTVLITKNNSRQLEGTVMPSTMLNTENILILKLESGYNIGIKKSEIKKIEVKKKGKIEYTPSNIILKKEKNKKNVHIISTGGTIASRIDYKTGGVIPAFSAGDMVQNIPRLKDLANLTTSKTANVFSEDMTPMHWKDLAKECEKELNSGKDGIVIMHGTDVMHYSTAMISFMLRNLSKPVVFVGAQRSTDRGSSDNEMNLLSAVKIAGYASVADVGICMHSSMEDNSCYFHQGTRVRKMHSSRRDTFRSIGVKPYLMTSYPELEISYLREDRAERSSTKVLADTKINPKVGLIKIHPYIEPKLISYVGKIYDGVILEGTGLGHVPTEKWDTYCRPILKEISNLHNSGVSVCMTTQTLYGRVNQNVYSSGRKLSEAGVIYLEDMLPETAFVKLMWVLGHTKNYEKIRNMMRRNYSGEITEKSRIGGFLE